MIDIFDREFKIYEQEIGSKVLTLDEFTNQYMHMVNKTEKKLKGSQIISRIEEIMLERNKDLNH